MSRRVVVLDYGSGNLRSAERALARVGADVTVTADLGVAWTERDITASAADLAEYSDMIPVTFVDGVQHDFWRVSEERLRAALRG